MRKNLLDLKLTLRWLYQHQYLAVLDRLAILYHDLDDLACSIALDLVHQLHRLDDAERGADLDRLSDLHVRIGFRRWSAVERTDDR